jgi:indolepyruvate ferredoxin oxidoreductase beta subunit
VKTDVVLAGVGGQGVLFLAAILAEAARRDGMVVKQGEVHGMAQRGGAVQADLRMATEPIESGLIPRGTAELILGLEPVEALRYLAYLAPGGTVVTSSSPLRNIPDYPSIGRVLDAIHEVPGSVVIDADAVARESGTVKAANVVMAGAASVVLPIDFGTLEECVREGLASKGAGIVESNVRALRSGRSAAAGR